MEKAYDYIKDNNGIDTEKSYPYSASSKLKCAYTVEGRGATDKGYVKIQHGREDKLKAAVASMGPIAVAIDASHTSFQMYHSGVYLEPACSKTTDHAVSLRGLRYINLNTK